MNLENELKNALARKSPSPGFASRVLAQAHRQPAQSHRFRWRALAAAVTMTALLGGWAAHTVAERRAGERAREELLLAMRIAGSKVHYAQGQVRDIGNNAKSIDRRENP